MKTPLLSVVPLFFSVFGLLGLVFFADYSEPVWVTIGELLENTPRNPVRFNAHVTEWKQQITQTALTLSDGNTLSAFIPADARLQWIPETGNFEFTGKLVSDKDRTRFWITGVDSHD